MARAVSEESLPPTRQIAGLAQEPPTVRTSLSKGRLLMVFGIVMLLISVTVVVVAQSLTRRESTIVIPAQR